MSMFNFKTNDKLKLFNLFFNTAIFSFIVLLFFRLFNSVGLIMDSLEHIHASWLISEGLTPYKDFFEHHNPLLWYLFAPVVKFFNQQPIEIIYTSRLIAILGYLFSLFLLYKITFKYTKDSIIARLCILLCLSCPVIWFEVQNLRPDIFMYIFILIAINYIFDYLNNHKTLYLCLSYFFWLIAFLFLQKTILYALGFFCANIILMHKRKILVKDALYAIIAPLLLTALISIYFYNKQILSEWFYYNFTFNNFLANYYKNGYYINTLMVLLALFVIRCYKRTNNGDILFFTWITSFWGIVYFSPHSHYYFIYFILTILLLSSCLKKFLIKQFIFSFFILSIIVIKSFYHLYDSNKLRPHLETMKYIVENSDKNDKLLNAHIPYNIFNYDTDFYWFGFHNVVIVGDLFTPKHFDYNLKIKTNKPKFVFIDNNLFDKPAFNNSKWFNARNSYILQRASKGDLSYLDKMSKINLDYWNIDMEFIKQNYEQVKTYGNTQIWKRIDN